MTVYLSYLCYPRSLLLPLEPMYPSYSSTVTRGSTWVSTLRKWSRTEAKGTFPRIHSLHRMPCPKTDVETPGIGRSRVYLASGHGDLGRGRRREKAPDLLEGPPRREGGGRVLGEPRRVTVGRSPKLPRNSVSTP